MKQEDPEPEAQKIEPHVPDQPERAPWHRPTVKAVSVADATEVGGVAVADAAVFS